MYRDDFGIQQDVLEELDWEPSIKAAEIGVTVEDGIVTLAGTVDSYAEKREAEQVALRLKGVKAIANELEVSVRTARRRSDADIAEAAVNAIKWNVFVPDEKIKVKVDDSWVTLQGEVEWNYQRDRAENVVRPLVGVRGVTNLMKVQPQLSSADVKGRIRTALDRMAFEDALSIHVSVSGSEVTLSGTVRSFAERNAAEKAAWAAPGVTEVHDRISVKPPVYA